MIKHNFRPALLVLVSCFSAAIQAQMVSTLTPDAFNASGDISVAADGEIFVANGGDPNFAEFAGEVHRVTTTGEVSLFVSGLNGAVGNVFDSEGNLLQVNVTPPAVYKITPAGERTTFSSSNLLNQPIGITVDSMGNVFVGNCLGQNVLKITPEGEASVFYSSAPNSCPTGVATDDEDNLYVAMAHTPDIIKITPQGQASTFANTASFSGTDSLNQHMIYAHNRLYLASEEANSVLEISMAGEVSVLAGTGSEGNDDGPLLEATFTRPRGIGISPDGSKIYVTSTDPSPSTPAKWTPNLLRVIEVPGMNDGGFQINAGLNDAWYNPLTSGQGFFIAVYESIPFFFIAWFTYDTERPPEDTPFNLGEPGHRWITGQGSFEGDTATLDIIVSEGGTFDSPEPTVSNGTDGTMIIEFADCENGLVSYDIESLDLQGSVPIQRVAPSNVPLCEMLSEP